MSGILDTRIPTYCNSGWNVIKFWDFSHKYIFIYAKLIYYNLGRKINPSLIFMVGVPGSELNYSLWNSQAYFLFSKETYCEKKKLINCNFELPMNSKTSKVLLCGFNYVGNILTYWQRCIFGNYNTCQALYLILQFKFLREWIFLFRAPTPFVLIFNFLTFH